MERYQNVTKEVRWYVMWYKLTKEYGPENKLMNMHMHMHIHMHIYVMIHKLKTTCFINDMFQLSRAIFVYKQIVTRLFIYRSSSKRPILNHPESRSPAHFSEGAKLWLLSHSHFKKIYRSLSRDLWEGSWPGGEERRREFQFHTYLHKIIYNPVDMITSPHQT